MRVWIGVFAVAAVLMSGCSGDRAAGPGQARPVRYYDTAVLRGGDVAIETAPEGTRAVLGGFTISCDNDGKTLTVLAPAGSVVSVRYQELIGVSHVAKEYS